jgi:hypothetical protein
MYLHCWETPKVVNNRKRNFDKASQAKPQKGIYPFQRENENSEEIRMKLAILTTLVQAQKRLKITVTIPSGLF